MSGYIGFVSQVIDSRHEDLLDRCEAVITSVCNDFSGKWKSGRVDLRFGLLRAIEDTADEKLPYTFDNNLWITGDIRLDKRQDLISALNKNFPELNSSYPDSYILLHAYMAWGQHCVNRISGDYSFAIWNEKEGELFCARDHFGIIPFYYTQTEDGFLFTNFYYALKEIPRLTATLNEEVLRSYLLSGNDGSFNSTIYKHLHKLPPAHTLHFCNGSLTISRYWKPCLPEKLIRYKTIEEYAAHFMQIFERSVADRLRSRHVASQLSGGMDSSSITAIANKILSKHHPEDHQLVAYNIRYSYLVSEREGYFAGMIAGHLNIELRQLIAEDYLSKLSLVLDEWIPEPAGIPHAVPERAMVKDAADSSLNVLLTGFGSDVLFSYNTGFWFKMLRRGQVFQFLIDIADFVKAHGRLPGFGIKRILSKIIKPGSGKKNTPPEWLAPAFIPKDYVRPGMHSKGLNSGMFSNSFWQSIFEHAHPGFNGNKLKVRHPFFSLELVEFLQAIPAHLLYNKSLLRLSMSSFLPVEVVRRPKTLLYGGAHFNNLVSSGVLDELKTAIKQESDFLKNKVDVPALLMLIENPDRLQVKDHRIIISIICILAWKKKLFCVGK